MKKPKNMTPEQRAPWNAKCRERGRRRYAAHALDPIPSKDPRCPAADPETVRKRQRAYYLKRLPNAP